VLDKLHIRAIILAGEIIMSKKYKRRWL